MRKLLALAAALLLLPAAASAQVYSSGQQGTIGTVVSATDTSGNPIKAVIPAVGGSVASGATDSGNPVKVGCVYNATLPTLTTGQRADCQATPRGETLVVIGDLTNGVGANVQTGSDAVSNLNSGLVTYSRNSLFNGTAWDRFRSIGGSIGSAGVGVAAIEVAGAPFSHITTNATTIAKSGAGVLHKVCVNTKGATANVATVYDNTAGSGTVIAVLDTTSSVGCISFDVAFATGLTIVTAAGTAGDLTVTYR